MAAVPAKLRWLFWDVDARSLDRTRHRDYILARVLERGRLQDVRWLIATYGMEEIHNFLRDRGSPELSRRTILFWRAALDAKDEPWAEQPAWRRDSGAPWID